MTDVSDDRVEDLMTGARTSITPEIVPADEVVHPTLATTYLGLTLAHPVVASAGPLTRDADGVRALADGGAAAIVLHSLFEEQLRAESARDIYIEESTEEFFAESLSFFPEVERTESPISHRYLDLLERAASAVDVPVIASLNGSDIGGWTQFARRMQDAGAAALELNVYLVPGDVTMRGRDVEDRHVEIVAAVTGEVDIPVAVKLSPYSSSFGELAIRLDEAGADGLVLFNRWTQPDIDIESVAVQAGIELSTPGEGRLPRTWIAALRGRVEANLAGTSGVETADDVVKYLLAGADVVMTTSSLVRHGPGHVRALVAGLESWMARKGFSSVDDVRGLLSVPVDVDVTAYERSGYVGALEQAKQRYGSLSGTPVISAPPVGPVPTPPVDLER
ncbi:dihydroorotate dehydrogenase-like protein [Mobilicoccus massiliensis]|uniref:dihydroorotate dehydrogenase-like protein n=1 Tax=Mobilicoccus massiliensis TaxID=1522310 RepID=UPI000A903250|nr:dihydroorotate dehydrogenase-like protein [Mobilicoccus massiliensis]